MVFNSLTFLVFIALFFPAYFLTKGRMRTWVCLIASYIFYGWWDWRFLSLIVFSTVLDWWFGVWITRMDEPESTREAFRNGSPVLRFFGEMTEKAMRPPAQTETCADPEYGDESGVFGRF